MTRCRHARRAAPLTLAAAVALGPVVFGPLWPDVADGSPDGRGAAPGQLSISDQDFGVAVDATLHVTVGLPSGYDTATLGAEGSSSRLVVEVHEATATLEAVRGALAGNASAVTDSVDISLDIGEADPRVTRPSATEISIAVQTESAASTQGALRLPDWGVYPVSVALVVDDERVGEVSTLIAWSAAPGSLVDQTNDLAVGLVLGATADPTIGLDGHVQPTRVELDELALLADALVAADTAAGEAVVPPPPRAVSVEPATLTVLSDVDPALAERLVPLLEQGRVIAQPRPPLDPSSATEAQRGDLYTRMLRDGEDALAGALPTTRIDRSILVATEPISRAAVALRRNLGTQLIIVPYDRYVGLEGNIGAFTDTSQLLALDVSDGTKVPAILIDPILSELLASTAADASLATAVAIVAQLVALADQIDATGGSVLRHGIVLARVDGGVPDPELLGLVTRLLLETDGVRIVEPSDLASIVDTQIIDGSGLQVTPAETAGIDLDVWFAALDAIARDVFGTASMLPDDDPLIATWTTVLGAVVSTALDDEEAAAMMLSLQEQVDVYRDGVQGPEPYVFRFTGRSGSIPFKLRNLTDRPLTVRIRMSSAKLEFSEGDRSVTLPPQQETEVSMPFDASSNGTSSVFLRIFTPAPEPSAETQIVDDVILTAGVTTLAGLGQLVTGAALLVLCTWWIRHWRQTRRRRLTGAVAPRHPAAAVRSRRGPSGREAGAGVIDTTASAVLDDRSRERRVAEEPSRAEASVAAAAAPDAAAGGPAPS